MASRTLNSAVGFALLRLRVHRRVGWPPPDPNSPEYLYLVQQAKRLSLSASIGRLRPGNLLLFPLLLLVIMVKALDIWIANQIIRSLINERDLLDQRLRADRAEG